MGWLDPAMGWPDRVDSVCMFRSFLTAAALTLVACSSRTIHDQDKTGTTTTESTSSTESETQSTAESETGGCDQLACEQECAEQLTDCDLPYWGFCVPSGCSCEAPPCPECMSDDECPMWESCGDSSCYPCGELMIPWDPDMGCTVSIEQFEPNWVPFTYVVLAGEELPREEVCADYPDAWMWTSYDAAVSVFELCPESCAGFEAAGVLSFGWCIAGD